ncbi:MAG: T9SS C-terminal target domain-containing protein [Acidobacteria bacterium]|nr:MAG: T9SS C-terminal target domain-containing protein [Acidobacteriota bacterium]
MSSDKLTSQPIDLSSYNPETDTVRLSFFYQAGGKGEVPEKKDSLLLEYYSPSADKWEKAWFAVTDTSSHFSQVILAVPEAYYQAGFRFRFRNYTSLSVAEVSGGEGALSNVDCWNVDYIMMDTRPASEHYLIDDISLTEAPRELLDFYESIPWLHLNDAQEIVRNFLHYVIRNLSPDPFDSVNVGRTYFTHDLNTGVFQYDEVLNSKFGGASVNRANDAFFIPFTREDDSPEGAVEVTAYLIKNDEQYKPNDTTRTILNFRDYYAYDDGTPEYGFGISGESAAGALLACRFRLYRADTLNALDILFNKTRNHFNEGLEFRICAWKDAGGVPGELIYMSPETFTPGEQEGMAGFRRYRFAADTAIVITDTSVFVGWKQVTEDFLNLGYDVNRNTLPRTYVNISGDWDNPGSSLIPGTVMIRAVFGKEIITGGEEIPGEKEEVEIYPNPASDRLFIRTGGFRPVRLRMVDLQGRVLLEKSGETDGLDVSSIPAGLYFLQLGDRKGSLVTRKVVIRH